MAARRRHSQARSPDDAGSHLAAANHGKVRKLERELATLANLHNLIALVCRREGREDVGEAEVVGGGGILASDGGCGAKRGRWVLPQGTGGAGGVGEDARGVADGMGICREHEQKHRAQDITGEAPVPL